MFRRRRGLQQEEPDQEEADESPSGDSDDDVDSAVDGSDADDEPAPPDRTYGPFDSGEVDLDDEAIAKGRIDLGALQVRVPPGMQLRIEVDQQSQRIRAATLVAGKSGLQLAAFAAPRSSGIWSEVSREIAADATKRGGTATATDGPYGPELKVVVPAKMPDGKPATQTTRVVGIDGPRWLLRGTFFGPAVERAKAGELDDALRDTIVVRGVEPMPPRDPLPLRMPAAAVVEGEGGEAGADRLDGLSGPG